MESYRRRNPLRPPSPFDWPGKTVEECIQALREAVRASVFGPPKSADPEKPICHRPVKRKLIGAFHEETLFGPVLDARGQPTGNYTGKKSVFALSPNHLRLPRTETEKEAIDRLASAVVEGQEKAGNHPDKAAAKKWAKSMVAAPTYKPRIVDQPPGKSGIVRDIALRNRLRDCLTAANLDPDDFSQNEIKKLAESGQIRHASGVPIRSFVLLRTMSEPVLLTRKRPDYATGKMVADDDPASQRAYLGGNNHHIEIRVAKGKTGKEVWSGEIVSAFEASQRKLARLRALRTAEIPRPTQFRELPIAERNRLTPILRAIEAQHPIVDRSDNPDKGGTFIMSLAEGEMLYMKRKQTGELKHEKTEELGYFVVAKLDKPQQIVLVPHWDARAAGKRKDADGKLIEHSERDQFSATPTDLKTLAPPDEAHAIKIHVSPLGKITTLNAKTD